MKLTGPGRLKGVPIPMLVHTARRAISARLRGESSVRSIMLLVSATALGQLVEIVLSPVLSRIYTPQEYGALNVYVSVVAILLVAASWRYELAVPLPEDQLTGVSLLALALTLLVVTCFLVAVAAWLLGERLLALLGTTSASLPLWLLPAGVLANGGYQVLSLWAVRRQAYARIARSKVSQSVTQVAAQTTLGCLRCGSLGLMLGDALGMAGGMVPMLRETVHEVRPLLPRLSPWHLRRVAFRYRRFPLISSWSSLLNALGQNAPPLLVGALYGPQVLGWFALGQRVLGTPLSLVGQSVSQVYFGKASEQARRDPQALLALYRKAALRLFLLGAAPMAAIALGGPWLFGAVFGAHWREAGLYVRFLSLMFLCKLVVNPLSQTLYILERQGLQSLWETCRLLLVVGGLLLVRRAGGTAFSAVVVYGVSMSLAYIALFFLSLGALRRPPQAAQSERAWAGRGGAEPD